MSRCGYSEDIGMWDLIRWRGAVASAIRGKRGQAFLKEMIAALDALPDKKLIIGELQDNQGNVCALGSVGVKRGMGMEYLSSNDSVTLSKVFGIAEAMVREIEFINDEHTYVAEELRDAKRWEIVRKWCQDNLRDEASKTR